MKISKPVKIGIGIVALAGVGFGIYKLIQVWNKSEAPDTSNSKKVIKLPSSPLVYNPRAHAA